MTELTLDDVQSRIVDAAEGVVAIRSASGRAIGVLLKDEPADAEAVELTPEAAREIALRMASPDVQWATTEEVLARLGARAQP